MFWWVLAGLLCVGMGSANRLQAQSGTCTQPVHLIDYAIFSGSCNDTIGSILLSVGNPADFTFQWFPAVSSTSSATHLVAGTYRVLITRIAEPECYFDTTFIVSNTNGPATQIAAILPANCFSADGKVTMTPTTLNYTWNNGETGAINEDLAAGCYIVTATQPSTGCYSVRQICIPSKNPLVTTATVLADAKCNLPIGSAILQVSGGSGNYVYSPGGSATLLGLAAGNQTYFVQDQTSGCADTVNFTIQNLQISADVNITTYPVKCPGGADGFLVFEVQAGANFTPPYTYVLRNNVGASVGPGSLKGGLYDLIIYDADGCPLPTSSVIIDEPQNVNIQFFEQEVTCAALGSVILNLSGGNGGFTVDWADVPGTNDGKDRKNVGPGQYKALVYDSLFCEYGPLDFTIRDSCSVADTLYRFVMENSQASFCFALPVGLVPGQFTFTLANGSTSGTSAYGSWSLSANGCLNYTANGTPGYALDTIIVQANTTVGGLSNTFCLIISITELALVADNVAFTVQVNNVATACGVIPPNFTHPVIGLLDESGLSGTSGNYGIYTINAMTGCITFTALNQSGFNIDNICVSVYDTVLNQATIICYTPSVLPIFNCGSGFLTLDSLSGETPDCSGILPFCVGIPYSEILNYVILDNGQTYNNGYVGCDVDTLTTYKIKFPSGSASYQLSNWQLNNQHFTGSFANLISLLALIRQLDPLSGWRLEDSLLVNDVHLNTYGNMEIKSVSTGQSVTIVPGSRLFSRGSELRFSPGEHEVVFRQILTGCSDATHISVSCVACIAIHNYTPNVFGNIVWDVSDCDRDTVFCTNILWAEQDNYGITDGTTLLTDFIACGNYVGIPLDTGFHALHIVNNQRNCEYNIYFSATCPNIVGNDTLYSILTVGERDTVCFDNSLLSGAPLSMTNTCAGGSGGVIAWLPTANNACIELIGLDTGQQTLCIERCDVNGRCARTRVIVQVIPKTIQNFVLYNGISPNGDGENDVWHLPGIEQFSNNEVEVFNRYGSRVYYKKGYDNNNAWNGTWNDNDLPDGTYYYIIDLHNNKDKLRGYLEIRR